MNATPTPIAILTPDQVAAIARDAYEAGVVSVRVFLCPNVRFRTV